MSLLRLEGVDFGYPGGFRIRDLNLEVAPGSFVGLIGPNGSGKTTVLRLLCGLLRPEKGKVLLDGLPLSSLSERERARALAVIPSQQYFEFPFSVEEVVAMGRFPHLSPLAGLSRQDRLRIDSALKRTATESLRSRSISDLSSGERQRVLLARALAQEPSVLLLDEPNAHLDIHHQLALFRLLRRLNRDEGMTLVVVLHDLTAAATFCPFLVLMDGGRIVRSGPPSKVIETELLREVYGADVRVEHGKGDGAPRVVYSADAEEHDGRVQST